MSKTDFPAVNLSEVSNNQKKFIFGSRLKNSIMLFDISTDDIVSMKIPDLI